MLCFYKTFPYFLLFSHHHQTCKVSHFSLFYLSFVTVTSWRKSTWIHSFIHFCHRCSSDFTGQVTALFLQLTLWLTHEEEMWVFFFQMIIIFTFHMDKKITHTQCETDASIIIKYSTFVQTSGGWGGGTLVYFFIYFKSRSAGVLLQEHFSTTYTTTRCS